MKKDLTGLPPLPEPVAAMEDGHRSFCSVFSEQQMRDYAQTALDAKDAEIAAPAATKQPPVAQVVAVDPPGPDGHGVNWLKGKRPQPGDLLYAQAALDAKDVEIAALRKALEFIIDVGDDTEKNPPEHRCYIEGTWKMAMDEARKTVAQAVQHG